jgi:pimeloyl-ACP methyl ester carboxylesterase
VITEAGVDPRVAALVYVSARAPAPGEDYAALAEQFPTPPASAGLVFKDGFGGLTEDAFLHDFANGIEPTEARMLYAAQGRVAETLFSERVTAAAWTSKPSRYAITLRDRTTAPGLQRFLAHRMRATTIEIDSGHLSLITHPEAIAELIMDAAS